MAKKKNRRKRKQSSHQKKASFKKEQRELRAIFLEKLQKMMIAIGAGNAFDLIPDDCKTELFLVRYKRPRAELDRELKLSGVHERFISIVRKMVLEYPSKYLFSFPNSKEEFTLIDYLTTGLTLKSWAKSLKENEFPGQDQLMKELQPFLTFCASEDSPEKEFDKYLVVVATSLSQRPQLFLYFFKLEFSGSYNPRGFTGLVPKLCLVPTDKKICKIDGHNRPVFSLVSLVPGPHIINIKSQVINSNSSISNLELKVYYQTHLLERIKERIDCFDFNWVFHDIVKSFEKPESVAATKQKALISFYFFGYKLGYFVVEAVNGIAVIRTFLFLTSDSTPEGKQLKKNIGLSKADKMYMHLDKLSTFLLSDLREDDKLCEILKESGCAHLLEMDPSLIKSANDRRVAPGMPDAEFIKKYLSLNDS